MFTDDEIRESLLYLQMYLAREKMSPKKRDRTRLAESKLIWKYPHAAELFYSTWIDKEFRENIVTPVIQLVNDEYISWRSEYRSDSAFHKDGFADIFNSLKNAVRNAFSSLSRVDLVGQDVEDDNEREWGWFVKEAVGIEVPTFTPVASSHVQEWADLNKQYLSDLPNEFVNKINQIVVEGVENGVSQRVISNQISEAGKKFRGVFSGDQKRAERIARDQVGKLNSTLSRDRMNHAKIDIYRWSTSTDERVRGNPSGKYPKSRYSHYKMEGMFKQVDNASKISDNGTSWRNVRGREEPRHAGQAINCRCTMIPSFIRLKQVVDKDIKRAA